MLNRQTILALCTGLAIVGFVAVTTGEAWDLPNRPHHLTFSRPVALPGVTLGAGTYLFERAAPGSAIEIVRVSSKDRHVVYFTGYTERVNRPRDLSNRQQVTFGEASTGSPVPITAWYPPGTEAGHRFIYR